MGMSTRVMGFRPPDEKWQKMKAIYDSCQDGGIEIPKEVDEFFNFEPPDPAGIEIDISEAVTDWEHGDVSEGFEIDVTKLPKNVTRVRFYNSY